MSYFQIYCETITDLLTGKQKLSVQNDPVDKDYALIKDLTAICISKLEDIDYIMNKKNETNANIKKRLKYENKSIPSTDGHCILTIKIIDKNYSHATVGHSSRGTEHSDSVSMIRQRTSTLCLIDMVGIARSGLTSFRLEEVKAINHSLTVFGNLYIYVYV